MHRQIVQIGAVPQDTDILNTNRYALVGLGLLALSFMGTGAPTVVNGLACTPGAGLTVSVGPGSIYTLAVVDGTMYGSLPADTTDQIVQQGIGVGTTTLSCPAPGTAGQSINYLIEAQYQQNDLNPVAQQYWNSATGQQYTGSATYTERASICALQVKAGTAATTGSQTTPAADSGWTGVWVVQVNNGQTSIPSGQITQAINAPFLAGLLNSHHSGAPGQAPKINLQTEVQGTLPYTNLPTGVPIWCGTSTGSANAQALTPSPALTSGLGNGQGIIWQAGFTNTASLTISVSGFGPYTVKKEGPTGPINLTGGETQAGEIYSGRIDSNGFLQLTSTELGSAALKNTGNTVNDPGTGSLEVSSPMGNTITGPSKTYALSDQGATRTRSNAGTNMADTMPATNSIGNGWWIGIINADSSANDVIGVPVGARLNNALNGTLTLAAGQACRIGFDGVGFWVTITPVSKLTASQLAYLNFANNGQTIAPGQYELDTSGVPAGQTLTLYFETLPVVGDNYSFTDFAYTWSNNPCLLNGNGSTVNGTATYALDVSGASVTFGYATTTQWSS